MSFTPMDIGGAAILWKLTGRTDRTLLKNGLQRAGFGQFTPDPRGRMAVLRDAIGDCFDGSCYLIRSVDDRAGYAVVREEKGDSRNTYDHICTFMIDEDENITGIDGFSEASTWLDKVKASYVDYSDHLTANQVANCLIAIIQAMGGVSLRPGGGVYWLPVEQLKQFSRVVQAVEGSPIRGESKVHVLLVQLDHSAIRAIADGVIEEVSTTCEQIAQEIESGELKERALRARLEESKRIREHVKNYEAALGQSLSKLHEQLDKIEQAEAMGVLLESAQA